MSALRPPYPYGGEFVSQFLFALKLCWFPLIVSTVAFGYGAPGLQAANFLVLFGALDRLGGFFVLAAHPRVRPVRDRDRARRRGRHRHHRRPRRPQDPRGARRPPGARRRPGQEPRRPALPRADARDGPLRRLRAAVRHLRRHRRHARQRRPARPVLGDLLHERVGRGPLGVGPQVHDVRRHHRDRLLLQGHDGIRRRRGRRPRGQPGRRHRHHSACSRSTTCSRRPCWPPTRRSCRSSNGHHLARQSRRNGSARWARSSASARASSSRSSR